MSKRQLAAFLLRFSASVAASFLIRLAAMFPIAGWLIGAIALLLVIKSVILSGKWALYRSQLNSPHYHFNNMSDSVYGGERATAGALTEETIGLAIWVTALLFGGCAAWYSLII